MGVHPQLTKNTSLKQQKMLTSLTDLCGQLFNFVLSYAEHGEFGQVLDVLFHGGDAIKAQVERGERGDAVDHGWNLPQFVMPQVKHTQLF